MGGWAKAGGGRYFDASNEEELTSAIGSAITGRVAIGTGFRVIASTGALTEDGTVGGAPVEVEPGTYRVEVMVDPPIVFDGVVVDAGRAAKLDLPDPASGGLQ